MKNKYRKPYLLFHFTMSYFLILLIPVVMGFLHFWNVLKMSTDNTVYTNSLILKNSMDTVENSLKSIYTYSMTLNQLKVLDNIVSVYGRENLNLLDVQNAAVQFPLLKDDNHYVDSYFLYSNRNDIILGPSQAFLNVKMYYGTYFDFGDIPFSEWTDRILYNTGHSNGVYLFSLGDGSGRLLYRTPYVSHRDGKVVGQIIYVLDENRIKNTLYPAFQVGAGFMCIEDGQGTPLITMEQDGWTAQSVNVREEAAAKGSVERLINGQKMVVTYCKSRDYGWTYVIAVPKSTLAVTALNSLKTTMVIMIFMTLIASVLIYAIYKYNMRPLMSMVQYLDPTVRKRNFPLHHKIRNGLWQLSGSITALVSDNSRLEEQLRQQQEELRQAFFVQLVTGQLLDEPGLPGILRSYGINSGCRRIRGVYLKILSREAAEVPEIREFIKEALCRDQSLVELVPCFWLDERHLTLLCLVREGAPPEACTELLRSIHFLLMEHCSLETTFAIGAERSCFSEVHLSFTEARKLLADDGGATPILRASEPDPSHRESYAYGTKEEETLLKLAGAGLFQEVQGLLGKIKRINFQERRLSLEMRELLFYRMSSTLLCAGWGAELPLNQVSLSALDTRTFFDMLLEQYEKVCIENARRLQESHEQMRNEIVKYIDENFRDSNMGLSILSQQFGITESYLSTMIKGLVGENFSSYLESKRINEANRLMDSSNMPISEIGRCVGYDNVTSFGRAYKRVMGHSPGQYLKLKKRGAEADYRNL